MHLSVNFRMSIFIHLSVSRAMASSDSKISDNPLFVSWCDSAWIPGELSLVNIVNTNF